MESSTITAQGEVAEFALTSSKTTNAQPASIGSFRDKGLLLTDLPDSIAALRSPHINWKHYTLQRDVTHLNHGAFGAVSADLLALETRLRNLADSNPSHFFDKLCLPLIRESIQEASNFFGGNVVLHPNCTIAMKSTLSLLRDKRIAILEPIYGATRKLISTIVSNAVTIDPGFFCEDPVDILRHLDAAHESAPFEVLVADRVTSQSGRLLPVGEVIDWCKGKGIVSVIDGTQEFEFNYDSWPDYFVMSTHKWLGNVKTCSVIRVGDGMETPQPVGISFGYPDPVDSHLWTGMLDYIPYIMLAKALRVYRAHGEDMVKFSSNLLSRGLQILHSSNTLSQPINFASSSGPHRVMTMVQVFRLLEAENLQDILEDYGVYVSVKLLEGKKYLRISAWTYNTEADFHLLRDYLQFKLHLNYEGNFLLSSKLSVEERAYRKRCQILVQFNQSMDCEDQFFGQLKDAGFFFRAESLRHPLIFYYGHVVVFYVNKLITGGFLTNEDRIDSELESLCAVGVDEMVRKRTILKRILHEKF